MAETRTHDPKDRDDLDRALRKALGDPVRPFEAGELHRPKPESASGESEAEAAADTPKLTPPASTLGSFTFRSKPASKDS